MSRTYEHGGNILSMARQCGFSPADSIDFSASINPLGFSPKVREAIIGALDSLVHYPDNDCGELKQALSRFHGIPSNHFAIANGSTEIIYTLPALLPGKSVLIISPSFSEYSHALLLQHCEVRHMILSPNDNFTLDLDMLGRILGQHYDALYLCNPGNPSGMLYSRQVVQQVHDLCRETGTFLVLDEAFMDFCEESSAKDLIIASDQGIVLRSMTKFYGIPGLRLGYAMAAPPLIERLTSMGGPWSVNTLAQAAGIAALADEEFSKRSITYVSGLRDDFSRALSEFTQLTVYPSSANFLLVQINSGITSTELKHLLMEKMILIRDCSTFTGLSNRFFRVAVRTEAENARLVECLKEILV
ncbi:MAG: threonine-phosphate decarboxylase [Desulfuromonadales bacterium]|nr:threonine-phosphate decarboxylase [Desulfuromonadales bacterium]